MLHIKIFSFAGLFDVLSYLGVKTLVGHCLASGICSFLWQGITIEFPILIAGSLIVVTPLGWGLGRLIFSEKGGRALIKLLK